jgi:hypothetical protein
MSSTGSHTENYVITWKSLDSIWNLQWGTKIAIPKTLLNTQDVSSIELPTQCMTYLQTRFIQRIHTTKFVWSKRHLLKFSLYTVMLVPASRSSLYHLLFGLPATLPLVGLFWPSQLTCSIYMACPSLPVWCNLVVCTIRLPPLTYFCVSICVQLCTSS